MILCVEDHAMTQPEKPLEIDAKTLRLPVTEYVDEVVKKDLIVLHYTAGSSARSAYNTWITPVNGQPSRVATAYVVDLDGTIYEMFPPEKWAWHLGMTACNPQSINDRRSIGIEIVNVGPLRLDSSSARQLNWWKDNYRARFCGVEERERYVSGGFRGTLYHASFPWVQVESVRRLVDDLTRRFAIPRALPPESKRMSFDAMFFSKFQGVASHQNFRSDKTDIGPAWDWSSLRI